MIKTQGLGHTSTSEIYLVPKQVQNKSNLQIQDIGITTIIQFR